MIQLRGCFSTGMSVCKKRVLSYAMILDTDFFASLVSMPTGHSYRVVTLFCSVPPRAVVRGSGDRGSHSPIDEQDYDRENT
jgi:hypothetical protein